MKTIIYIAFAVAFIAMSCKQKTVDIEKAKSEVAAQLDKYKDALANRDIKVLELLFKENGFYCGSDPKEFWDKKAMLELSKQMFADTSMNWKYNVDKREIRVAQDGQSAIALDQFVLPALSKNIAFRIVFYLTKEMDSWKFDFYSAGFIPRNEDVEKLNKALD